MEVIVIRKAKRSQVPLFIVLVAASLAAVCGGGSGSSTSPSSVTPSGGSWAGTTSEGLRISFTVSGSTVSSLIVGLKISANGGPLQAYNCDGDNKSASISGGRFSMQAVCLRLFGAAIVTVPVNGTFTSSTAANGTVSSSTWQASK